MATAREILDAYLARMEPAFRQAFAEAIQDIRSAAQIQLIIGHLERGDINAALAALNLRAEFLAPLDRALAEAYWQGGRDALTALPTIRDPNTGGRVNIRFAQTHPRAERWIRDHSSQLIVEILEDQREGIRGVLTRGAEVGRAPRTLALDIVGRINRVTKRREGGLIGLTSQQMQFVDNMRAELSDPAMMGGYFERKRRDARFDRIVARAMRDEKPVAAADIEKISGRYKDRLLELRGTTIARNEVINAFHSAQFEGMQQVVDTGAITEDRIRKVWKASGDRAVRDSHVALHNQERGFREPFRSPLTGALMLYPHDRSMGAPASETIQCRCTMSLKLDSVSGLRRRLSPSELAETRALMRAE